MIWVAFIGAGLAAREGKHIRIDVAYRMLPDGMKRFRGKDKAVAKKQATAARALEDCARWLAR